MTILLDFTTEDNIFTSSGLIYIKKMQPLDADFELTEDKNASIDLKVSAYKNIDEILKDMKLDFLPIYNHQEVSKIAQNYMEETL